MNHYKDKQDALIDLLKLKPGMVAYFPDFAVALSKQTYIGMYEYNKMIIHWNSVWFKDKNGSGADSHDVSKEDVERLYSAYRSCWTMFHDRTDWLDALWEKIFNYVKSRSKKKLVYKYYPEMSIVEISKNGFPKGTKRVISNKNLCKIDGLNLRGDVSGIYGTVKTDYYIKHFSEPTKWVTNFDLSGKVSPMLSGDITNIYGIINENLTGDVSGISGCITNITGNCTGIVCEIQSSPDVPTNIKTYIKNCITSTTTLLSNEQSEQAFNAYRKLAHCTLGLTEDERNAIDSPSKVMPPFQIDRWGRYYYEKGDEIYVYSINPSDIMFLKELGPLNSCFCMTTQSAGGRYSLGMRCLMALNCTNPNLACVFTLNKREPIRRMRMFKDLDFKWFKPQDGCFFQYDKHGNGSSWSRNKLDPAGFFQCNSEPKNIKPIEGHDGINNGHSRQKRLAYLELFIQKEHSWVGNRDENFDKPNKITNNEWDICYDDEWVEQDRSSEYYSRIPDNINELIEDAKKAKRIIDGIKI